MKFTDFEGKYAVGEVSNDDGTNMLLASYKGKNIKKISCLDGDGGVYDIRNNKVYMYNSTGIYKTSLDGKSFKLIQQIDSKYFTSVEEPVDLTVVNDNLFYVLGANEYDESPSVLVKFKK